jgi:hypothetical protein
MSFWLIAELHWYFLADFQITDRDHVFAGIFIGLPLGNVIVLWFLNKFVYKERRFLRNTVIGLVLSLVVEIFCLFLVDTLGNLLFIVMPMAVSTVFVLSDKIVWKD